MNAGATALVQPGGSIRDKEVIDAANQHNVAMYSPESGISDIEPEIHLIFLLDTYI